MRKARYTMKRIFTFIAAVSFLSFAKGKSASAPWLVNDKDFDYESITPEEEMPRIVSESTEIQAEVGSKVVLPCEVVKLGKYSVVWQRGNNVLWVLKGNTLIPHVQNVVKDERIANVNTSLVIHNISLEYDGDYSCEIMQTKQSIQHRLIVNERPSVKQTKGNFLNTVEDNPVELSCNATGVPKPTIHWKKGGMIVIEGMNSSSLFIESVKLSHEGIYVCVADNGVGEAAEAEIALKVNYPPQVEAPLPIVYSGVGYNVDLFCIVQASPEARVQWFRSDADPLTPLTLQRGIEKNDRYYVSFQPVHVGDFGEYICHASNFWGNDTAVVELSGRPVRPTITNVRRGDVAGQYILSWEVESYSSIASYDVFYKEGTDTDGEWANVTVPGYHTSSMYSTQLYTLEDITPDVSLMVKIKARNEFGDSDWSDIGSFVAKKADTREKIKLVTRETSQMDPDDAFFQVTDTKASTDEKDKEDLFSPSYNEDTENVSSSFSAQNDSNNSSSSGFPNLTPAQKKAQMVALITAISLSSFFC